MDENNVTNDASDVKGLSDEGVDIIAESVESEESPENESSQKESEEIVPVFPEDSNLQTTPSVDLDALEKQDKSDREKLAIATPINKLETPRSAPMAQKEVTRVDETIQYDSIATNDPSIRPLRTFKTDTEEAIRDQHIGVTGIAVAESIKRERTPIQYEEEKKNIPWVTIILSLLFIGLGSGGLYYVFQYKNTEKTPEPVVEETILPAILKADKQSEISVDASKDPLNDFVREAEIFSAKVDSIVNIYPTTESSGKKTLLTAQQFFTKAEVTMPARLLRSLGTQFMLGTYVFDGNTPFIILKTTFFQNAYSGMLEWEKNIPDDLYSLISKKSQGKTLSENFEDSVIKNKDVRTLKTTDGTIVLMYVFIDQNTILIANNQKGLEGLVDKMTATRVTQ